MVIKSTLKVQFDGDSLDVSIARNKRLVVVEGGGEKGLSDD